MAGMACGRPPAKCTLSFATEQILENSPYSGGFGGEGQYTRKVFHLGQKLPSWLR